MHICVHIWALQIWSSGVSLKRSCKMQFRPVGLRSKVMTKFHQQNHKTCSSSFKSSKYLSLKSVNTKAAEQTNKMLRAIASSKTYMSPQMFMKAITVCCQSEHYGKSIETRLSQDE